MTRHEFLASILVSPFVALFNKQSVSEEEHALRLFNSLCDNTKQPSRELLYIYLEQAYDRT